MEQAPVLAAASRKADKNKIPVVENANSQCGFRHRKFPVHSAETTTTEHGTDSATTFYIYSEEGAAMIPDDQPVLALLRRSPSGASALEIAKASLGSRARRHSNDSLNMTGLGIAARLCGEGLIEPTRTNHFRLKARAA